MIGGGGMLLSPIMKTYRLGFNNRRRTTRHCPTTEAVDCAGDIQRKPLTPPRTWLYSGRIYC